MDTKPRLPNFGALLRKHFFADLLVLIPLGVIAWILGAAVGMLWGLQELLPLAWRPENFLQSPTLALLVKAGFTVAAALLLALGISIFGWISKQFLGKKLLELIAEIIHHIPVIRSVYSALDQLLKTLAEGGGQQFNRVVLVEYPRKGIWTLAFVTGTTRGMANVSPNHLNIYVPTTPNPTSGFYLIVPESDVRESHMTVEEAFKVILSLGIAGPAELKKPEGTA